MNLRQLRHRLTSLAVDVEFARDNQVDYEVVFNIHGAMRPVRTVKIETVPLTVAEAANEKKPKKRIVLS